MGKNKKRNKSKRSASQRLEEIALQMQNKKKAKKLDHDDEKVHDDDTTSRDQDTDDDMILITAGIDRDLEDDEDGGDSEESVTISKKELEITIDILRRISPDLVQSSSQCRELRKVLHKHTVKQMQKYEQKIDYRIKVTNFLKDKQWSKALQALEACRDYQLIVKQGAIQRWVRDCNTSPQTIKLKLLTGILSLNNNHDDTSNEESSSNIINQHDPTQALLLSRAEVAAAATESATVTQEEDDLTILEPWSIPIIDNNDNKKEKVANHDHDYYDNAPFPKFPISEDASSSQTHMIIYQEKAAERKPPNHYDLLLHYTPKSLFQFSKRGSGNVVQKHTIDFLKDDTKKTITPFLLENVLTKHECQQLMGAATTLGYRPDHPTSLDKPTGIDSCEWLIDETTLGIILQRVKAYLPDVITTGNQNNNSSSQLFQLHSINPRWRFFRYAQNCVYRPHIDGSWPASWVSKNDSGEYIFSTGEKPPSGNDNNHDSSSTATTTRSYLTFLIYLNDNFDGGQTRFYFADENKMMAKGVKPLQGSVLVFPQGNTASLIHEGSAVTEGTKYVIRSDVIYSSSSTMTSSLPSNNQKE